MKGARVDSKNSAWCAEPDSTQEHFVDVTPCPIFARLKRSDDRMAGGVKMFRRVTVWRGIAAAHVSARQAESQVDPGRTHLQTFLATIRAGDNVIVNLIQMRADFVAHDSYLSITPNSISPPPTNTV